MQKSKVLSAYANAALLLATGVACADPTVGAQTLLPKGAELLVAADGGGQYKTLQEAIAAVPDNSTTRTVIHIKPGLYQGQIILPLSKRNVTFEGEDAAKTVLTFAYNTNEENPPSVDPHQKGVGVVIASDDFRADKITFQNTSGDHGQALALKVDGDRAAFSNCRLLGWQDTLMVNNGRQYFKNCYIEGRVDFIYGSGTAVFDHCQIHSKNGGHVTAANTPQEKPFGLVFLNCALTGDPYPWIDPATGQFKSDRRFGALADLGRPWRPYASVAYINCKMDEHIAPSGWNNWGKAENEKTARYSEYNSQTFGGKPVDVSQRFAWAKQLSAEEAAQYTIAKILGGADNWVPSGSEANPNEGPVPLMPTVITHSEIAPAIVAPATRTPAVAPAAPAATTPTAATAPATTTNPIRGKVRMVLAGDSTVTDGAGWGAGFKKRLKSDVELINLAKGGRSSGSFVAEGLWKQALDLKPDYVLIQFGHNDQPGHGPERETDPKTTYRANMERYISEAEAVGIHPILVTSLSRRQWGVDGKIHSTLEPYAETVKEIAAEKHVPLIDLHALSIALYEKMGKHAVEALSATKPGGIDGTHLNPAGGDVVGKLVADALRQAVPALATEINPS